MKILQQVIFDENNTDIKYQYIIGNPPWGYEFSKEELADLKRYLCLLIPKMSSLMMYLLKNLCHV